MNIIKYCNRPFSSIDDMDEALINYWNLNVKPDDIIYHLGDFCFGLADKYLKKLNGRIILIRGSHDDQTINQYAKYFHKIFDFGTEINYNNNKIILCHYCMRTWSKSHYNSYHAYGHSHGKLNPIGKSYDVGVDNNHYRPISIDEFITIMNKSPDNPNYIKNRK